MNILVTGANGYIGHSIVDTLSVSHVVLQMQNCTEYNVSEDIFSLNLLDKKHINSFLKEDIIIDSIIHVASKMASSKNVNDMNILYDNLKMYEHIVLIAKHFKIKKIINFSSIAVYPNIDASFNETSLVQPSVNGDALYGLSKFCGENILDYMLQKEDVKIINMRVGQVFSDDLRDDRLYIIMKKELQEFNTITVYGNGKRVSNFMHKKVLMQKILFFVNNNVFGIFNVGDENLTYKEFAQKIIKEFGDSKSKILFNVNGLKSKCYIDTEKLNQLEADYV
ncbi:NAD(P)-dependent oxidoreductase [Sulfurimonas sp. SAG-AH-194-I05]|nr:NAD(P)-dependent oxidoreductase [Sulfurimonas sp. SAG-AH-194-I05]MDF1874437.1 NAD(P)-dependent oxidoreductase [Sulfurimonas sp. SAG-AH-194-I05]